MTRDLESPATGTPAASTPPTPPGDGHSTLIGLDALPGLSLDRLLGASGLELGAAIRQERQRAGIQGQDLAKRAGVHPSTLSRIERGERENPDRGIVLKVVTALAALNSARASGDGDGSGEGHAPASAGRASSITPNPRAADRRLGDALTKFEHALESAYVAGHLPAPLQLAAFELSVAARAWKRAHGQAGNQ